MFSLYYEEADAIEYEGVEHPLDASFDNILKIIDMTREKHVVPAFKIKLGLQMFFGRDTDLVKLPINQQTEIFNQTFENYVNQQAEKAVKKDLAGKPLPDYQKDKENFYSLKFDAEYIFSSFLQAYGIDLIEARGKLHWFKFQALLAGLPEDTKFRQVVSIRMWKKPSKNDSEAARMRELQEFYRLPDEGEVDDE